MYTILIYDYKGCVNCFGHINTEDRYIIINKEGFDEIGENFTKKEAIEFCKNLNNNL
jgi:hypothetical protein